MFDEDRLLPISALQHLLFCQRQCALIHIERLWAENRLTVEGGQLHRKAHDGPDSTRPGVRTARGMVLTSRRLGLFGVADVVEFRETESDDLVDDLPDILPIEYKRGKPKAHDADRVQLCAQALCIEEMLHVPGRIAVGAIFYGRTRRRESVPFDAALRARTEQAAARFHEMIAGGITPKARREKKCDRCSLLHLCLPDAMRPRKTATVYLRQITGEQLAVE